MGEKYNYKTRANIGAEKKDQIKYSDERGAELQAEPLCVPGEPLTGDFSAAGIKVEKGSILRVRVAATTFVAFGSSPAMAIVSATTNPSLELFAAGTYLIRATDDFMRTDVNLLRVEKTLC